MKFCIHIDTDKVYTLRLSNDIWDWLSFCWGSNSETKWDYCKMTFIIGRGFAERQILKKWKWPYLLNFVEYIDRLLRKHWYYQDLAQEIAKWHFSSVEAVLSSKFWKVKMALSLEPSGILWWNLHTHWYWHDVAYEIVKWHLWSVVVLPRFISWKQWNITLKPFKISW